jgi:hypothetical protein
MGIQSKILVKGDLPSPAKPNPRSKPCRSHKHDPDGDSEWITSTLILCGGEQVKERSVYGEQQAQAKAKCHSSGNNEDVVGVS